MIRLKIFHKLGLSHFFLGTLTLIIVSFTFYKALETSLIERTTSQVNSINVLKKTQIINYVQQKKRNFKVFKKNILIANSIKLILNDKHNLANTAFVYSKQWSELIKDFDYKNVVILDTTFKIIYSSNSLWDSTTFSIEEKYFKKLISTKNYDNYLFYKKSSHTNGGQLFITGKVISGNKIIGIVIAEKKLTLIWNILQERTGMGATGESYLVGDDYKMLSKSRFFPDTPPSHISVKTQASITALKGKESFGMLKDYRGVNVISAYRNISIDGIHWGLISEIDVEEAMSPVYVVRNKLIGIAVIIILLIAFLTIVLSKTISIPILNLKNTILSLAFGKIQTKPLSITTADEIGEMTAAVNKLSSNIGNITSFAQQVGKGDFNTKYNLLSNDDSLGLALIEMQMQLKILKEREYKVNIQRTSTLIEGEENERRRISRELHDGIAQMLTAAKLKIESFQKNSIEYVELKNIIDETISEVKRLSTNLMPSVLIDYGLESALRTLCKNSEIAGKLKLSYIYLQDTDQPLPFEIMLSVYRIAQESLNNLVKHSEASEGNLYIIHSPDFLVLEISDNGTGLKNSQNPKQKSTLGIRNMQERARLINGKLTMESSIEWATIVRLEIKLNDGE